MEERLEQKVEKGFLGRNGDKFYHPDTKLGYVRKFVSVIALGTGLFVLGLPTTLSTISARKYGSSLENISKNEVTRIFRDAEIPSEHVNGVKVIVSNTLNSNTFKDEQKEDLEGTYLPGDYLRLFLISDPNLSKTDLSNLKGICTHEIGHRLYTQMSYSERSKFKFAIDNFERELREIVINLDKKKIRANTNLTFCFPENSFSELIKNPHYFSEDYNQAFAWIYQWYYSPAPNIDKAHLNNFKFLDSYKLAKLKFKYFCEGNKEKYNNFNYNFSFTKFSGLESTFNIASMYTNWFSRAIVKPKVITKFVDQHYK